MSFFNTQIKSNSWEIKLQIGGCCCCNAVPRGVFLLVQIPNRIDRDVQEACRLGFHNYLIVSTRLLSGSDTQERKAQESSHCSFALYQKRGREEIFARWRRINLMKTDVLF